MRDCFPLGKTIPSLIWIFMNSFLRLNNRAYSAEQLRILFVTYGKTDLSSPGDTFDTSVRGAGDIFFSTVKIDPLGSRHREIIGRFHMFRSGRMIHASSACHLFLTDFLRDTLHLYFRLRTFWLPLGRAAPRPIRTVVRRLSRGIAYSCDF